jgi:hypothetical protein
MRMRVTVVSSNDRKADLKITSAAKSRLSAQAPIWEDSEHPLPGIHRDNERRFYFEFATDSPQKVREMVAGFAFDGRLVVSENPPIPGEGCQNCGNVAGPILPSVCPNCDFRDISPCPNPDCPRHEVPRREYVRIGANLFRCPACATPVRFRFNEPMFLPDGTFNPPLVVVDSAEAVAAHEVR